MAKNSRMQRRVGSPKEYKDDDVTVDVTVNSSAQSTPESQKFDDKIGTYLVEEPKTSQRIFKNTMEGPVGLRRASQRLDANDEHPIERIMAAEDTEWESVGTLPRNGRKLEDVDYWRKRAGWYDDDASMLEYNQGVYDTYYSLDDLFEAEDGEGGGGHRGGSIASGKIAATAVKALLALLGVGLIILLFRALRRRSQSESGGDESDKEGRRDRKLRDKSKPRSGSASRSSARRRSSSRPRSKSVSGSGASRSRSKSLPRSRSGSGPGRSRSRSRKTGDNYELMDEEEARSTKTGRSSRSRSRSKKRSGSRSRSKARRDKEEMLV